MPDDLMQAPSPEPADTVALVPESPPPASPVGPRWRLDAVALSLFLTAGTLAVAVGTYPPLSGTTNALGPIGDRVAASVLDAIGWAVLAALFGWVMLVGLYVAKGGPLRISIRTIGWCVLVAVLATGADLLTDRVRHWGAVSIYGAGGAVGAFLRLRLEQMLGFPQWLGGLAGLSLLGLTLAADWLVRGVTHGIIRVLRGMWKGLVRGNQIVAHAGDKVIAAGETAAAAMLTMTADVPSVADAGDAGIDPSPPAVEMSPASEPIPITRPDIAITGATPTAISEVVVPPPRLAAEGYELPPLSLLTDPDPHPVGDHEQQLRDRAALLEKAFQDFGLSVKVVGIHAGPVVTQYEIALETGLRLSKVTALSDDLALALAVQSVRIVAPIPGRTTVGIEVPNEHRQTVRLKEIIATTTAKAAKFKLPIFLGKDVEGRPLVYDMATMPHLLIAGRTGTGKSVCLNTVLLSFLFTRSPDECRLILIDPKQVEFSDYGQLPHLMTPVVTKNEKAEAILAWAVDKMEERYELLRKARVRNIASFNELGGQEVFRRVAPTNAEERDATPVKLPYIVIVIDEVGDLIMAMKKEVENHIIRLAQKSRAAGIHLILATQRPTVDVITGLIKSNLPARICFQVASRGDSAVVLDEKGAEKLLGMGDMLFLQPGTSSIIRGQGAYVDDQEIQRTTESLMVYETNFENDLLNLKTKDASGDGGSVGEKLRSRDPLYEQAVEIVIREQRGSTSLLQRALGIGYGKASRFIDWMAEDGIVGSYNGSNARDVLVSSEEWELRKAA
ncbi:MAG: DNA translocase FtsK [Bacteroidales bacterium]|nr:DNA translocase FtsK [Bacteroidales bacterium]